MSGLKRGRETGSSIASKPIRPSTLVLDRRKSKIARLQALRQKLNDAAGPSTVDHEVNLIRDIIRNKALDEEFSVAIRERWQTWSRNANPFRSTLASSAASDLKSADHSASDSEDPSAGSATEDVNEPEADEPLPKKKRGRPARAKRAKALSGKAELDVTEEWEAIRREREAFLADMDAVLPKAFQYNERQLKVYAHRLKTKYVNSLDRPFEAQEAHRLLLPSSQAALSAAANAGTAQAQQNVFTVSLFSSSIDWSKEASAAKSKGDSDDLASDDDGDKARDDYVRHICGDGLGGMRRTQTAELLSTQTLSDLHSCLICWSDEQPERCDWRDRLRRYVKSRSADEQPSETALGTEDDDAQHVCLARFTGQRRQTDAALVIEDKLYVKGTRHGDAAFEADYATLIDEWKSLVGNSDSKITSLSKGGGLDLRLDQLDSIRVGQPYWILHQGDCVHCFVVEQVRALRPSEQTALRHGLPLSNIEGAPVGTAFIPFPRITWLSTPTMLRFAADDKHNYGLGHHILRWEDSLAMTYPRAAGAEGKAVGEEGSTQGDSSVPNPWQVANLRTRRKDEGLLRKKQGKCLACSWRKAQVGILGGKSVRLPLASVEVDEDNCTQSEAAVDGLDDYLTSICTPCAAILGLPTLPTIDGDPVALDWDRINTEKDRQAGWTVFPMY